MSCLIEYDGSAYEVIKGIVTPEAEVALSNLVEYVSLCPRIIAILVGDVDFFHLLLPALPLE